MADGRWTNGIIIAVSDFGQSKLGLGVMHWERYSTTCSRGKTNRGHPVLAFDTMGHSVVRTCITARIPNNPRSFVFRAAFGFAPAPKCKMATQPVRRERTTHSHSRACVFNIAN